MRWPRFWKGNRNLYPNIVTTAGRQEPCTPCENAALLPWVVISTAVTILPAIGSTLVIIVAGTAIVPSARGIKKNSGSRRGKKNF
jgi:hypothetical protein